MLSNNNSPNQGYKCTFDEEKLLSSLLNQVVAGNIENGGFFTGQLVSFNDKFLFLKGDKGQDILIRRKWITRLEADI
jgi:hypothetical protein